LRPQVGLQVLSGGVVAGGTSSSLEQVIVKLNGGEIIIIAPTQNVPAAAIFSGSGLGGNIKVGPRGALCAHKRQRRQQRHVTARPGNLVHVYISTPAQRTARKKDITVLLDGCSLQRSVPHAAHQTNTVLSHKLHYHMLPDAGRKIDRLLHITTWPNAVGHVVIFLSRFI